MSIKNKKNIHFIGICGTAMAPIAKALSGMGFSVSGSDAGIYPPMSNYLKNAGTISFYPGFHPDRIPEELEFAVVGNAISESNPEFQYIKEKGIPYYSYPEIINKFFVREKSIVVAGTAGKSSTTASLIHILKEAGYNPSYMVGAIALNFEDPAYITDSNISVFEGDEYPSAKWDLRPKFFHYNPTHLILTHAHIDHMDVYRSEDEFLKPFKDMVTQISDKGFILANYKGVNIERVISDTKPDVYFYQLSDKIEDGIYNICNIKHNESYTSFKIVNPKRGIDMDFKVNVIGDYMVENVGASIIMASLLGVDIEDIKKAVEKFRGIRRRLEIKGKMSTGAVVIDDFSHSPLKIKTAIRSVKKIFPDKKIIGIYEPNLGSRVKDSLPLYDGVFKGVDVLIVPKLKPIKSSVKEYVSGKDLAKHISRDINVEYIDDDSEVIKYIFSNSDENTIVLFMGSGSFRNMIEQVANL